MPPIPTIRITTASPRAGSEEPQLSFEPDLSTHSVSKLAKKCIEQFEGITRSEFDADSGTFLPFVNRFGSFMLWIVNTGATAKDGDSLETRLSSTDPTSLLLVKMGLFGLLSNLKAYADQEHRAWRGADELIECIDNYQQSLENLKLESEAN